MITQRMQRNARIDLDNGHDPATILAWISDQLGGYGVEYTAHCDDTPHRAVGLSYVNRGDTYRATVLFNHRTGRFLWGSSWGDVIEQSPEGTYR